jgi:hypothetical protein
MCYKHVYISVKTANCSITTVHHAGLKVTVLSYEMLTLEKQNTHAEIATIAK